MSSFAKRLRELRKNKGVGQKEVGAVIGVSDSSIRKYEAGDRTPTPEAITTLASYFGVTTDYLLGHHDNAVTSHEQKKPQDLKKILEQHEIMFDGIPVDEEAKADIMHIVEFELYKRAKEMNKRKKTKDGETK